MKYKQNQNFKGSYDDIMGNSNIEIIDGIEIYWNKYKGSNINKSKKSYIELCKLLHREGHELLSDYIKILNFLIHIQSMGVIDEKQRCFYSACIQDYLKQRKSNIEFLENVLNEIK